MLKTLKLRKFENLKMDDSDFKRKANSVFYKTSSQAIGSRCSENLNPPKFSKTGAFSKHLLNSGM